MTTRRGGSYQYNALCAVCGFKLKNHQLKRRWDGLWVCEKDFEYRHPMDFYTTRNDTHPLPWTSPDNNGTDVGPTYTYPPGSVGGPGTGGSGALCTVITRQPLADIGTADCATLTS